MDQPSLNNTPSTTYNEPNEPLQNATQTQPEEVVQNKALDGNVQTQNTSFEEKPGGLGLRFSASVFDAMILSIPLNILFFLYFIILEKNLFAQNTAINIFYFVIYIASVLIYFTYFNVKYGATPGKKIYGMKIVDLTSKNYLTYKNALIRGIANRVAISVPFIGYLYGVINFFVILSSPQRRGIHDKLSNSQVLVVKKSWPFIKQLGLFILLIFLGLAPLFFVIPKFMASTQELNLCVLECANSKNSTGSSTQDLQKVTEICYQECTK